MRLAGAEGQPSSSYDPAVLTGPVKDAPGILGLHQPVSLVIRRSAETTELFDVYGVPEREQFLAIPIRLGPEYLYRRHSHEAKVSIAVRAGGRLVRARRHG